MHIIARPALVLFWHKHPKAKAPLSRWHDLVEGCDFDDFNALREVFPSADYVEGWIVFNIGGNHFRLIASIHFNRQKLYIRAVLTHAEYDSKQWMRRSQHVTYH